MKRFLIVSLLTVLAALTANLSIFPNASAGCAGTAEDCGGNMFCANVNVTSLPPLSGDGDYKVGSAQCGRYAFFGAVCGNYVPTIGNCNK